jgi:hypothetical protein
MMSRFYSSCRLKFQSARHMVLRMNLTIIGLGEAEAPLLRAVGAELGRYGISFRVVTGPQLAGLKTTICGSRFLVDEMPVAGVLTHDLAGLDFSGSDPLDDQAFFNAELRATWLAGMNLASVLAINRYPASAWHNQQSFREVMREAEIPVASFPFAGEGGWQAESDWLPYAADPPVEAFNTSMHSYLGSAMTLDQPVANGLWICGELISGSSTTDARDTAHCLDSVGIRIVEISTDVDGRVFSVNPRPDIRDPGLLKRAAVLISNLFRAHLHH